MTLANEINLRVPKEKIKELVKFAKDNKLPVGIYICYDGITARPIYDGSEFEPHNIRVRKLIEKQRKTGV